MNKKVLTLIQGIGVAAALTLGSTTSHANCSESGGEFERAQTLIEGMGNSIATQARGTQSAIQFLVNLCSPSEPADQGVPSFDADAVLAQIAANQIANAQIGSSATNADPAVSSCGHSTNMARIGAQRETAKQNLAKVAAQVDEIHKLVGKLTKRCIITPKP